MKESVAKGRAWHAPAIVAGVLFCLATVVTLDANRMATAVSSVGVPPTVAMRLIAVLLGILAIAHLVMAFRARNHGAAPSGTDEAPATNRGALAWVLGGLIGMILVLQFDGGFIVGATWLFAATARAFGQPLRIKSPLIGLVLAVLVYAFFTKALSLSLPAGPLERLLLG